MSTSVSSSSDIAFLARLRSPNQDQVPTPTPTPDQAQAQPQSCSPSPPSTSSLLSSECVTVSEAAPLLPASSPSKLSSSASSPFSLSASDSSQWFGFPSLHHYITLLFVLLLGYISWIAFSGQDHGMYKTIALQSPIPDRSLSIIPPFSLPPDFTHYNWSFPRVVCVTPIQYDSIPSWFAVRTATQIRSLASMCLFFFVLGEIDLPECNGICLPSELDKRFHNTVVPPSLRGSAFLLHIPGIRDSAYPPIEKELGYMPAVHKLFGRDGFDFVYKFDSDTIPIPERFQLFWPSIDPNQPLYTGRPIFNCRCAFPFSPKPCDASTKNFEPTVLSLIGSNEQPSIYGLQFCSGAGYVTTRAIINRFVNDSHYCRNNVPPDVRSCNSSDSRMGVCMAMMGLDCQPLRIPGLAEPRSAHFSNRARGLRVPGDWHSFCQDRSTSGGVHNRQLGKVYHFGHTDLQNCAQYHPLKTPEDFQYIRFAMKEMKAKSLTRSKPTKDLNSHHSPLLCIGVFTQSPHQLVRGSILRSWGKLALAFTRVNLDFIESNVNEPNWKRVLALSAWFDRSPSSCQWFIKMHQYHYIRIPPILRWLSQTYYDKSVGNFRFPTAPTVVDLQNQTQTTTNPSVIPLLIDLFFNRRSLFFLNRPLIERLFQPVKISNDHYPTLQSILTNQLSSSLLTKSNTSLAWIPALELPSKLSKCPFDEFYQRLITRLDLPIDHDRYGELLHQRYLAELDGLFCSDLSKKKLKQWEKQFVIVQDYEETSTATAGPAAIAETT